MRRQVGLSVSRFCEIAGVPRASWYRHARRAAEDLPARGPWPAPVRDRIEQPAAQLALEWPAWGHRKIHALLTVDGFEASQATVRRALARRGLLQPVGYQRERRELAKARKAAFVAPPARRNRVWQTDFSELETAGGGTWQMSGVVDYVAKLALCCPVTTTKTWREAVGALENTRGVVQDLLGLSLLEDCTCPETGQIIPVIVVSDNGPCYRAVGFARYIASRPELSHVRTPPPLARHQRRDRALLPGDQVRAPLPPRDRRRARARRTRRRLPAHLQPPAPHEALQFALPIDRYTAAPTQNTADPEPSTEESVSTT